MSKKKFDDLIDTETFVIKSLADVEKIRLGAKLSQNGFEYEINQSRLISLLDSKLFLLKGATVTQKKTNN